MEPWNSQPPVVFSAHCDHESDRTQERSNRLADTFKHDIIAAKNTMENFDSLEIQMTDRGQARSARKCGRPRLDTPGAAVLSQERRVQVRRAQKTYRLKKEATLQSYKTHIVELERKIKKIAELFSECNNIAIQSDVHMAHPNLFMRLHEMRRHLAPELEELGRTSTHQSPKSSVDPDKGAVQANDKGNHSDNSLIFGYQVLDKSSCKSPELHLAPEHTQSREAQVQRHYLSGLINREEMRRPPFPDFRNTERLLGQRVPITYSFHETIFSRRLHRYSLEHAYRLFTDPGSDPTAVYQVFRLVSCIRDKTKMSPYFKNLVRSGIKDPLELPTLPFYCIGGAGTHYPRKDAGGHPIYPSNMRLPRRILGVLPTGETSQEIGSENPRTYLKLFGFDGDWFDCEDVQGYLEEKGVILDQSSLFAEICVPALNQSPYANDHSLRDESDKPLQSPRLPGEITLTSKTRRLTSPSISRYILDVECFFTMLLNGLVILGRAPGFKRSDVEIAFKSALQIQT